MSEQQPTRRRSRRRTKRQAETTSTAPSASDIDVAGSDRPAQLADALELSFKDLELLRQALTHRSVVHDVISAGGDAVVAAAGTNERLEFLGDAILGALVAEYLYRKDPLADEGKLTRRRVALVRAETLVRWARELNLGAYLFLGQGEQPSESSRDRILATAFEALIGAIFLDGGMTAARRFLLQFLKRDADELLAGVDDSQNPKGQLQELTHDRYKTAPVYRVLEISGPPHAQEFTIEVALNERSLGVGSGASKRDAEQRAAAAALEVLTGESGLDSAAGA